MLISDAIAMLEELQNKGEKTVILFYWDSAAFGMEDNPKWNEIASEIEDNYDCEQINEDIEDAIFDLKQYRHSGESIGIV